jgi:DNA-binding IscR family transcriptional regulator
MTVSQRAKRSTLQVITAYVQKGNSSISVTQIALATGYRKRHTFNIIQSLENERLLEIEHRRGVPGIYRLPSMSRTGEQ